MVIFQVEIHRTNPNKCEFIIRQRNTELAILVTLETRDSDKKASYLK